MKGFHPQPNPCNDHDSDPRLPVQSKAAGPSEDAAWQLLGEHAVQVQLSAHQVLLNVLQCPLVVSQLQCLPLRLSTGRRNKPRSERAGLRRLPEDASTAESTLKALFVSAGIAMAAPLICSCIILDWSAPAGGDKRTLWVQHGFMMERLRWLSVEFGCRGPACSVLQELCARERRSGMSQERLGLEPFIFKLVLWTGSRLVSLPVK